VFELDVTEQQLDRAQVRPGLQEVGRERMPQEVGRDALLDAGSSVALSGTYLSRPPLRHRAHFGNPTPAARAACSLTLSAYASPLAPSAKPDNFYEAVRVDAEAFWADYFSSKLSRTYTPITEMQLFTEQASSRCTGVAFYCSGGATHFS
jgi:predicted metalloprotease